MRSRLRTADVGRIRMLFDDGTVAAMAAKIYSILETYSENFVLLLMNERFNLGREIGIMVQLNNSI